MDASLLKSKASFMKAASTTAAVQIRPQSSTQPDYSTYDSSQAKKKKKKKSHKNEDTGSKALDNLDSDFSSSNAIANSINFSTMAKIVDYMKKRLLNSQHWALSLQEILDEIQVYDLSKRNELWLREALPKNPRLQMDADGKFTFKPPYKIKNKVTLIKVLEKQHQDGKGGILLSDLSECIPNAEKTLESLGNQVIIIPTQVNKRKDKVFFYNDPSTDFEVDEEFKSLWRMVSVDHLDEKKIEEYLVKHGIDTMRDLAPKKNMAGPPKRKVAKRKGKTKVHNEHLDDVLEDY